MTIIERICQMISERGLLKKALYENIGVSASTFSTWVSINATSIPSEYVPPIARFFGITCDELLTGETQIVPDADEKQLLFRYRALPWDGQQMVLSALVTEARRIEDEKA